MKVLKKVLWILLGILTLFSLIIGFLWIYLPQADFGFAQVVSEQEETLRNELVEKALSYLNSDEGSEAHYSIIDCYNAFEPLPQGYEVKYDDNWCATFVSFVAIECGLTEIIPTECSCQRQISLWQNLSRWEETDSYLPLPGDIIYYDWDVRTLGDSTGWSDHVGIVVGTHGPFIKVIEGNKDDTVSYRYIIRWDPRIRGYGLPNYG